MHQHPNHPDRHKATTTRPVRSADVVRHEVLAFPEVVAFRCTDRLREASRLAVDRARAELDEIARLDEPRPSCPSLNDTPIPSARHLLNEAEALVHTTAAATFPPAKRGNITGWSARSRSRMLRACGSVDWNLDESGNDRGRTFMLTLTYPGEWWVIRDAAGAVTKWRTPEVCKAELDTFRKRYERRWGPLPGAWKQEYQARTAPHYHVGAIAPAGTPLHELAPIVRWCQRAWHEIACHDGGRCPHQFDRKLCPHAVRGAHADLSYSDRIGKGRSTIASYFAKHGVWASKAHQNVTPTVATGGCSCRPMLKARRRLALGLQPSRLIGTTRLPVDAAGHAPDCGNRPLGGLRSALAVVRGLSAVWGTPVAHTAMYGPLSLLDRNPDTVPDLDAPDPLQAWADFVDAWETPGRWWGVWRMDRIETLRADDVPQAVIDRARLLARKVIRRRTQRLLVVDVDGTLRAVMVARTQRSLHGDPDRGFWLTARNGADFMRWLLHTANSLRDLVGLDLARALAEVDLPKTEPAREYVAGWHPPLLRHSVTPPAESLKHARLSGLEHDGLRDPVAVGLALRGRQPAPI